jgi:glycosyltransferase involved in cell wall biosynthesis
LYSLLSGWKDDAIELDIWGTKVRPRNIGSGNPDYQIETSLWPPGRKKDVSWRKLRNGFRQIAFVATHSSSFDVVHLHTLSSGTLLLPLLIHVLGRKVVYQSSLYGSDNPGAVRAGSRGHLAVWLMRWLDGVVAMSPLLADDYRAFGFRNVVCLPNFLAIPQLKRGRDEAAREQVRKRLSIPADAAVLLFVGSVIERKGVDLLAECYARLASRHQDLWMIVVGPKSRAESQSYDERFVRGIRERMSNNAAASRVIWTGTVSDKDALARYYSAADIFVFPTRAEGMPNVVCEAMTSGLPVVATNLQGITDFVIEDGKTGFLFPPEDIDALTEVVERLVLDPTLRAKMGQTARESSRRFGFEEYCTRLKAFYLKVAKLSP